METVMIREIIYEYSNGSSLNEIARKHATYPTTVKRVLEKNGIKLRDDAIKKGDHLVKDGEKLIEWAKAQGRLVTKSELARIAGTKRLSPSYFEKYPELGKYVVTREQKETQYYTSILYAWLKQNGISYKPNDRTKLGVSVTALLLEEYVDLALQVDIKPRCVSKKRHAEDMKQKLDRAKDAGIFIICLHEENFDKLDEIKDVLDAFKK